MEQRIGSSSRPLKNEPVKGAGFDPAFIPGLTPPAQDGQPADAAPGTEPEETPRAAPGPRDAVPEPVDAAPAAEPADAEAAAAGDADAEADAAADGPVFEAADRRARIVADRRGVRLSLDDQECEFRWDEIGAVETETPRFGKRFTVTVHTPERRWYPIEIEAPARSRFAEWEARLDAVLDAYFEEGAADATADDATSADDAPGTGDAADVEEPSKEK